MKCSRCRSLFDPAHDGSLERRSPLRAEFEAHLSSCPDCSEGWGQWQEAMTALHGAAAGRASREETEAVLQAVELAAQRPAGGQLPQGQPAQEAAFRHGLLLAAAQQDAGQRRRVAALLVGAACGALAASVAFMLWWPQARTPAPAVPETSGPAVASVPVTVPATHREPVPIVIDTRPLADVLHALAERVQLAWSEAAERAASPSIASTDSPSVAAATVEPPLTHAPAEAPVADATAEPTVIDARTAPPLADAPTDLPLADAPSEPPLADALPPVAPFDAPRLGEVVVSRADGRLSLTLMAASADDVPDFRALVPPLLLLLSTPDEEVAQLAEARLESVRSQVERLTGLRTAIAGEPAQDGSRRDSSAWRQLLGLRPADAPSAPAGERWRHWWEQVEPLLPDAGGAT